ncbi:NmrA family NAD(P)-binding protein [Actinomadura sp. WAC 06369]|uniref:NmrA family NAD(P)-binding protein n=1 Tax=Actinomadura sp. WAC 06369 TaxID=2203193 RepID=UPI000F768601|nr:NmrA family NAD(P)-binding protein [Actinomadura sp. WAC 06369]RSN70356.1 NmrA family transcriptional regulator [Actinomadura sp. WAC 06369]
MSATLGPVLVIGATGRQGGAAARHLLADGRAVRVLVRDPASAAARALAAAGAEPVRGDLDDPASLAAAMAGAHGAFVVTPDDRDGGREIRRGRAAVDAAAEAGVSHLVFASVGGAERSTGIPYWESKWAIEQHIAEVGTPATVLRPVRFMENHTIPGLPVGGITPGGVLRHLFDPDVPVQLIAVTDIGAFAALAFADPDEYAGRALELAGDELTAAETVELIGERLGRAITYEQVADVEKELGPDAVKAFSAQRGIWRADIADLRRRRPALLDFPAWLDGGGAEAVAAVLDPV